MNTEPSDALRLFISGVAALNQQHPGSELHGLLAQDLLAYRQASGLAEAWPEARGAVAAQQEEALARYRAAREERGRKLWARIHRRALAWDGSAPEKELAWLTQEVPRLIPGCRECKEDYVAYLAAHPPVVLPGERKGYFGWTVALHNHVNRKLGKPEVSPEAARAIWSE